MKLIEKIIQRVVTILSLFGIDYRISPVTDLAPTEGSTNAVSSGEVYIALEDLRSTVMVEKSDVPIPSSSKYFTAGGAYADKTDGCVTGNIKNFTSGGARKYLEYVNQRAYVKNWAQSPQGSLNTFAKVEHANGLWVAGSDVWVTGSDSHGLWWSLDGKNWAIGTVEDVTQTDDIRFGTIRYGGGRWLAGLDYGLGSHSVWTSTDGKSWSTMYVVNMSEAFQCHEFVYANGLWVLASTAGIWWLDNYNKWHIGKRVETSSDMPKNQSYGTVAYANGIWVTTGRYSFYWSTDGKNWNLGTSDDGDLDRTVEHIVYGNGVFVACTRSTGKIWCSANGKDWNLVLNLSNIGGEGVNGGSFDALHYADGMFVAIHTGSSATNYAYGCWWSTDGRSWTKSYAEANPTSKRATFVAYGGVLWLAQLASTMWSTDGKNWHKCSQTAAYLFSAAYSDGFWVAGGNKGLFYSQPLNIPASLPD